VLYPFAETLDNFSTAVCRSVINDDDLTGLVCLIKRALDRISNEQFGIIARDYDAYQGATHKIVVRALAFYVMEANGLTMLGKEGVFPMS
jgi:hypothetical protein